MFKKFTNGCVALVQRFLPDPFIFCIILTVFVFLVAMPVTGQGPLEMVNHWGGGIWTLLAFSMQMALVLVLGSALANAPSVKRVVVSLASIPKTPFQGIVSVTVFSVIACWINWGFGLVVGAILAKEIAKQVKGIDYRLLIASAYSGFIIWHAGLSASIPLTVATGGEALTKATGGAITEAIPTSMTIFSSYNLIMCAAVLIIMPFVNGAMHPSPDKVITIDTRLLKEEAFESRIASTPAEKMEDSRIMSALITILGLAFIIMYFKNNGFKLDLNIVNTIFLIAGILLHGTPLRYVNAIGEAVKGAGGIILQFPFYAGIMGMMTGMGAEQISLAGAISNWFVSVATPTTFPVFSFLSAGVVNLFVPSGGGQWAVQAPIMMPASLQLGVEPSVTAMAIAWGDAWTNMIQPFWALPALGIAGLGARDIMGYCVICLLVVGLIVCGGFIFLV
ncbi:MAG: short-chain fatty acid transporter [Anaerovorax sp.]|nr:short-chain fatty acid transporter [Anaerovorax sp.]